MEYMVIYPKMLLVVFSIPSENVLTYFMVTFLKLQISYKLVSLFTGWPKLKFEVYHMDDFGRNELYGYGFCHLPTSPGIHNIECPTWRPSGSYREGIAQFFIGGAPQLRNPDMVHSSERFTLQTVSMGKVHLKLGLIFRNFEKYGVEC